MNVYLLPHHRLDPRFQYNLEREVAAGIPGAPGSRGMDPTEKPPGRLRRYFMSAREYLRRMKVDYDTVVHGHEQIRLSRLVITMDRDPSLTLVIPADMTRERALQAIRGVIRSGQMAHRSSAIRNVVTAVVMMIFLFGAIPTHIAAVIFYPLIALYAWGRYWEDRLIRRTMTHLLEDRLAPDSGERFREEAHLAQLEELFSRTARPDDAYRQATDYLDGLDHKMDGLSQPQHALMFNYYRDIGRLDPYERYQDRIRKKLVETVKLIAHHLWAFWKGLFRWTFGRSLIWGHRVPNWVFVVVALGLVNLIVWGAIRHLRSIPADELPPANPTAAEVQVEVAGN